MPTPLSSPLLGFGYPFRGLRMVLSERALRRVAAVPVLANLLLYAFLAYATFAWAAPWLADFLPQGGGWWRTALRALAWPVLGLLYLLVAAYTFIAAAGLIAAPFNDLLAGRTERIIRGETADTPLNWRTLIAEARYTLRQEAVKAAVLVLGLLALLLLNLVPVAGTALYAVLSPLFTMTFITLNFTDVIMSRRKLGFRQKVRLVLSNAGSSLGFGAATFVSLMVPGHNVRMIGGAVVGGTRMYLEQWEERPANVA